MSVIAICNAALARTGVSKFISSLEEESVEAGMCRSLYPTHLETLLVAAPWPFATRRATLAEIQDGARGGYRHAYALPEDCLVVQDVFVGRSLREDEQEPFAIEYEGETRILLTDRKDAEIRYTTLVENTRIFHPAFRDALSWSLAVDLSAGLRAEDRVVAHLKQQYEIALSKAVAQALSEGQGDPEAPPKFLTARLY